MRFADALIRANKDFDLLVRARRPGTAPGEPTGQRRAGPDQCVGEAIVDSGGTLVSSSPTISISLPRSWWALSMFEDCGVVRADRVAHPLLVPGRLVHPVVVAAAVATAAL